MKRYMWSSIVILAGLMSASIAVAQEQFPIMDKVASKVIQKYQQESCPQIAAQRDQPKTEQQQRVIQLLRDDANLRRAFIDRVAAPIANKLFECGLIP